MQQILKLVQFTTEGIFIRFTLAFSDVRVLAETQNIKTRPNSSPLLLGLEVHQGRVSSGEENMRNLTQMVARVLVAPATTVLGAKRR